MTPEQIQQLLALLTRIADRPYTITGAADWPILAVVGGLLIAIIGAMWADLRATMREGKDEWRGELRTVKLENEKGHDLLWGAMRDCQGDCCPRANRGQYND